METGGLKRILEKDWFNVYVIGGKKMEEDVKKKGYKRKGIMKKKYKDVI